MKQLSIALAVILVFQLAFLLYMCHTETAPQAVSLMQDSTATHIDTTTSMAVDTSAAPATAARVDTSHAAAAPAPLTLVISNLRSPTSSIIVGVYGTKNKFPDPNDQLKVYTFKPNGNDLTAKIKDLPFGTYALAIYQDVNENGKIDKNMIGIPTEPYAFSNNYKPTLHAPAFKDCSFAYSASANVINMTMSK